MRRTLAVVAGLLAVYVTFSIAAAVAHVGTIDVGAFADRAPASTALMRQRAREAQTHGREARVDRRWVPYARISPLLRRAVLVAEDDAFFSHDGLDWNEIRASARHDLAAGRLARGGSTVTQQLARNLWLGTQRTLTRKLEEMFLAVRLERALSKRRIFELYLNEIEWGDGVYGIEAAARRDFGVSAAALDARQAVLLAAVIINPRRYSPLHPSRRIERRARMIASRLRRRGVLDDAQYAQAIGMPPPSGSPGDSGIPPVEAPAPETGWAEPGPASPVPAPAETLPRR